MSADQVWCKWCKRMVVVGETHSSHIEIVTDSKMKPGEWKLTQGKCAFEREDGSGSYCAAINVTTLHLEGRIDETYPHRFWRTDCYGKQSMCRYRDLFLLKPKL